MKKGLVGLVPCFLVSLVSLHSLWAFDLDREAWLYTVSHGFITGSLEDVRQYEPSPTQEFSYGWLEHTGEERPLVVLIPGFGREHDNPRSKFLGDVIFSMGFHVLSIDSPFARRYIRWGSETGVAGLFEEEAHEIYSLINHVLKVTAQKNSVRIERIILVGTSMGGVNVTHIREVDHHQAKPLFERTILINPALDLQYGIEQLDQLLFEGYSTSRWERASALAKGSREILLSRANTLDKIQESARYFIKNSTLTERELKYLVANNFWDTLLVAMKTMQSRGSWDFERWLDTFQSFLYEVTIPFYISRGHQLADPKDYLKNLSPIRILLEKDSSDMYLIHNVDDFLIRPQELNQLSQVMGDRATIFSYGGHMGNVWDTPLLETLYKYLGGKGSPVKIKNQTSFGFDPRVRVPLRVPNVRNP